MTISKDAKGEYHFKVSLNSACSLWEEEKEGEGRRESWQEGRSRAGSETGERHTGGRFPHRQNLALSFSVDASRSGGHHLVSLLPLRRLFFPSPSLFLGNLPSLLPSRALISPSILCQMSSGGLVSALSGCKKTMSFTWSPSCALPLDGQQKS